MKAYKGFDKDLRCRGFQYEIGKEYVEEEAELCNKGFHACEFPLDVLGIIRQRAEPVFAWLNSMITANGITAILKSVAQKLKSVQK